MFDWLFKPSCPCDRMAKAWVEKRLKWLAREFDGAGTDLNCPEYMNGPMLGWALAHLAWFRGEDSPAWAKHLNSGARANLKQGLRYLKATADTSYPMPKLRRE